MNTAQVSQNTSAQCPLCGTVIIPVQVRATITGITAWYRCPDGTCSFIPVRVNFNLSKEVLEKLCQHMPQPNTPC